MGRVGSKIRSPWKRGFRYSVSMGFGVLDRLPLITKKRFRRSIFFLALESHRFAGIFNGEGGLRDPGSKG